MRIVTVCRSGLEYGERQARFFHKQLRGFESACLTDISLPGIKTLPLRYPKYPGWWSKMELFDPAGPLRGESFLYIDLDTKVVGDLNILLNAVQDERNLVMLRDFFRPTRLASGVMYIPTNSKGDIWGRWQADSRQFMLDRRKVGDGGVIQKLHPWASAWQSLVPDRIISYKKHVVGPSSPWYWEGQSVGNGKVPKGTVLCCYHGNPRPWRTE